MPRTDRSEARALRREYADRDRPETPEQAARAERLEAKREAARRAKLTPEQRAEEDRREEAIRTRIRAEAVRLGFTPR